MQVSSTPQPIDYYYSSKICLNSKLIKPINTIISLLNQIYKNIRVQTLMQLSEKQLTFNQTKVKQALTLNNESDNRVIYKVKINNTETFQIYPGKGFIAPHDTLQMQITLKKYLDAKGKLLLVYAYIPDSQDKNYDKIWNNLHKNELTNQIVEISCSFTADKAIKSFGSLRKVESIISEPFLQDSNLQKSEKPNKQMSGRRLITQSVVIKKSETNTQKIGKAYKKEQSQQEQNFLRQPKSMQNTGKFQNKIEAETDEHKKLMQKLLLTQQKIKLYEELAQTQTNNSLKPQDQQFTLSSLNICLLMVVCILFGFFLAKVKIDEI